MRCRRCLVGWASRFDGLNCWSCGEPGEMGDVMDVGAMRPTWQTVFAPFNYVPEEQRRAELGEVA